MQSDVNADVNGDKKFWKKMLKSFILVISEQK